MYMKQPYRMLTLLVPGPKGPGNDIDVYLQPLVKELQELWNYGLETYDALTKHNFCLHTALLWTISDFPVYAYLSGWSTKEKLACSTYNKDTPSVQLKYSRKFAYMCARRFLAINHKWCENKYSFNGKVERRDTTKELTRNNVLE